VTVLGDPPLSDEELAQTCRAELQVYFPKAPLKQLRLLRVYRIPFAQFVQPPGFQQHLFPPIAACQAFSGLESTLTRAASRDHCAAANRQRPGSCKNRPCRLS
jgi:hypothetical protein